MILLRRPCPAWLLLPGPTSIAHLTPSFHSQGGHLSSDYAVKCPHAVGVTPPRAVPPPPWRRPCTWRWSGEDDLVPSAARAFEEAEVREAAEEGRGAERQAERRRRMMRPYQEPAASPHL